MKRYFMIFSAAVAAVVSCHKEPAQEPNQEPTHEPQVVETHEVTIDAGILSKTALEENAVMWEGSDEIALVFTHTSSAPHVNRTFVNQEAEKTTERALFKGQIPNNVSEADGYNDLGYAVYPKTAITDDGIFSHNLPSVQVAKENGSFPSGCNLSSAALALSDMGEGGSTKTDFRNALSILRIALSEDVESVTVTGTAPLAGTAPLQMYYNSADAEDADNGRLLVDAKGTWSDASTSVTLTPANGTVFENKTYNVLVWPGKQEGLTITLQFKNLGEYEKASSISASKPVTFKPARYYNLNVSNTEELVVTEITGKLDDLENSLPDLDELEGNVEGLLNQIQSVSLMTEYLDNAVYAPYSTLIGMGGVVTTEKGDIELTYMVRPAAVVEKIAQKYSEVMSAVFVVRKDGRDPEYGTLSVTGAEAEGDILTVTVGAGGIPNDFYNGNAQVQLALQLAVSDSQSSILSDFANLYPKEGAYLQFKKTEDIPVLKGSTVSIPFRYAPGSSSSAKPQVEGAELGGYDSSYDRTVRLYIAENEDLSKKSVVVTLGSGDDVLTKTLTFVDGGRFQVKSSGEADYIGGEVSLTVEANDFGSYSAYLSGGGNWVYETTSGTSGCYTFTENTGSARSASVDYTINTANPGIYGDITYTKSVSISQKAYGTSLSRTYYTNGQKVVLNQATSSCANKFNIVILGDGYKKKDLVEGGKFERSARSAMGSFFAVEPYKTFKDRFNVYMVAYESNDEGTDIKYSGITKDTYFNSYCQGGGNTAAYVDGTDKVTNAVKNAVGSSDAVYYRSIAILLLNTDEQAGSTGYPFRDYKGGWPNGYASFSIAVLAANSTGTNGLIKHEAGGDAFGRLADEYYTNGTTATSSNKSDLSNWHAKGWYWNVNPSNSGNYYKFTNSAYNSSEVSFIEGGWGYNYGMYRPTQGGMMQGSTGVFNAPSRHAIFHRIITESEGASAYSWQRFLDYDKTNR